MSAEAPSEAPRLSIIRGKDSNILEEHSGKNLLDILWEASARHPDRGISIYDRRGENCETKAYPKFLANVRLTASSLSRMGVKAGDKVLVALPTSWDMLNLWLGCVFLGAYPAAIAPPTWWVGFLDQLSSKDGPVPPGDRSQQNIWNSQSGRDIAQRRFRSSLVDSVFSRRATGAN